jgi:hypothetical protein
MSTNFKTASFYYDFHLLTIFNQIKGGLKTPGLEIPLILYHLLLTYKQPPLHATNFIKQVKIKLKVSPTEDENEPAQILKYFFENCKEYGFEKTEVAPKTTGIYYENKANE